MKIKAKRPTPQPPSGTASSATKPATNEGTNVNEIKPEAPVEQLVEKAEAETVVEESTIGVNVGSELPQESDPIADGSMEKLMETVSTDSGVKVDLSQLEEPKENVDQPKAEEPAPAPVVPAVEEVKPVVVQQPIPPAPQAAAPVVEAKDSTLSEEEKYLDQLRQSGTMEQKRMLAAVETFAEQLKPKAAIEPEKGAKYQHEFLKHLLWILEKDYEAFRGGWNALLVYFSLNHGVNSVTSYTALSEFSTTRFMHAWTKGADACTAYRNLVTLLRATRKKETRKHDIKTINLQAIGPNVLSEKALANLKQFYGI